MSRQFILESHPDAIVDIVGAANIERSLYLTLRLLELDRPMVVALNAMDGVAANGGSVDVNLLERLLGVPVVPISAAKNEGIDELVEHAVHVARYRELPGRIGFCPPTGPDNGALHRCIHGVAHLVEDHARRAGIPVRLAATRLVEGDPLVTRALAPEGNELDAVEHIISQMEEETGTDRLTALADMRFSSIDEVCARCVVKPREGREHARSQATDRRARGAVRHAVHGFRLPGVHAALPAVRGGDLHRAGGAGRQVRRRDVRHAVRRGLGRRARGEAGGDAARPGLIRSCEPLADDFRPFTVAEGGDSPFHLARLRVRGYSSTP